MTKHTVTSIKDFDISTNGRNVVLNFADDKDRPVSLKISTIELERVNQEIGFAITKARKLSDISKQGIIPFIRAAKWRAELLDSQPVVVISFALQNGLEVHYGLSPIDAPSLARQILDASQRGISAKPQSSH